MSVRLARVLLATTLVAVIAAAAPLPVTARVVNVEFRFTPFVGDPTTRDEVTTVAGRASVFLNGIPIADQDVDADTAQVFFAGREIAAPVWLPIAALGAVVRRGTNVIRIVFEPRDAGQAYRGRLGWAQVTDETTTTEEEGRTTATNQSGEGFEDRDATGRLVIEHAFDAPFAVDHPWHRAPAETALAAPDVAALHALLADRIAAFAPDFARLYALLEGDSSLDVAAARALRCIEQAHAAGLRIVAPPPAEIEMLTTGHAEVVLRAKDGPLFRPADPSVLARITDEDVQMCAALTLMRAFPPRLIVVRGARAGWIVVDP